MTASKLATDFAEYAGYHRTPGNQNCHLVGIPMITVSVLGLLALLRVSDGPLRLDGGLALLVFASLWYATRDWRITLPFALVSLGMYALGRAIPWPALVALFVVGWIFQLVGHSRYEKKRPALLENLKHVLVGPLWIFAKLVGYRPG